MTFERQVDTLFHHLRNIGKIDRVEAFKLYGIADLRSRICNVEQQFAVTIDRNTKPGFRYKEYFLKKDDEPIKKD